MQPGANVEELLEGPLKIIFFLTFCSSEYMAPYQEEHSPTCVACSAPSPGILSVNNGNCLLLLF